jgi:hypothetical protein
MPMATVQITKSLSSRTVQKMKPGDKIKTDTGKYRIASAMQGYRSKDIFHRYASPITSKLVQVKIGHFP